MCRLTTSVPFFLVYCGNEIMTLLHCIYFQLITIAWRFCSSAKRLSTAAMFIISLATICSAYKNRVISALEDREQKITGENGGAWKCKWVQGEFPLPFHLPPPLPPQPTPSTPAGRDKHDGWPPSLHRRWFFLASALPNTTTRYAGY